MAELDLTVGCFFIAVILSATLLGASFIQVVSYYTTYEKDPLGIKLVVAVAVLCDLGHQISVTAKLYDDCVSRWGDPEVLNEIGWGLVAQTFFGNTTAFVVQHFYLYRIYRLLNRNWIVPGVLSMTSFAQLIMAYVYGVKCTMIPADKIPTLTTLVTGVNGIGAALDIIIASIMVGALLRNRTGFQKTDTLIYKLITYIINSNALTSACALGVVVSFVAAPQTYIAYIFYFCAGRLYVNSLLATLNARQNIRNIVDGSNEHWTSGFDLTSRDFRRPPNFQSSNGVLSSGVLVSVEHEQRTDVANDSAPALGKLKSGWI